MISSFVWYAGSMHYLISEAMILIDDLNVYDLNVYEENICNKKQSAC